MDIKILSSSPPRQRPAPRPTNRTHKKGLTIMNNSYVTPKYISKQDVWENLRESLSRKASLCHKIHENPASAQSKISIHRPVLQGCWIFHFQNSTLFRFFPSCRNGNLNGQAGNFCYSENLVDSTTFAKHFQLYIFYQLILIFHYFRAWFYTTNNSEHSFSRLPSFIQLIILHTWQSIYYDNGFVRIFKI